MYIFSLNSSVHIYIPDPVADLGFWTGGAISRRRAGGTGVQYPPPPRPL
jgi:hypothetical protein